MRKDTVRVVTFALRDSDYLCNITVRYNQPVQSLSFQLPINASSFYWLSVAVSFALTREAIHCVTMSGRRFNCELSSHCEIQLLCRLCSRVSPARVSHTGEIVRAKLASPLPNACPCDLSHFMMTFGLINMHFIITHRYTLRSLRNIKH